MELLYRVCYVITSLTTFGMAVFVLTRPSRTHLHTVWGLFNILVCAWSVCLNAYVFDANPHRALLVGRLCNLAAAIIPVFFAHFCLALVNRTVRSSVPVMAGYAFCAVLLLCVQTPWFVPAAPAKLFFKSYVSAGPLFHAFTVEFFSLVGYAFWLLLSSLKRFPAERQNQIRWVAVALLAGFGFGSTAFLLVYDVPVAPHASLFTSAYVFLISYAILKHQLMDIKVAVTRTGLALGTYFVVLGGPIAISLAGQPWLERVLGRYWWGVPVGLSTVLATIGGVGDLTTLIAAVLHDTIEDTATTGEELEQRFGHEVRLLVEEMTDDKRLPKAERKRLQVEHARVASHRAKLIKLGDKICNVRDVTHAPPDGWSAERRREYLDWTAEVVSGCRGASAELERRYDSLLAEGRKVLEG